MRKKHWWTSASDATGSGGGDGKEFKPSGEDAWGAFEASATLARASWWACARAGVGGRGSSLCGCVVAAGGDCVCVAQPYLFLWCCGCVASRRLLALVPCATRRIDRIE